MSIKVKSEANQFQEPKAGDGITRFFKVIDKQESKFPVWLLKDGLTDDAKYSQKPDVPLPIKEKVNKSTEMENLKSSESDETDSSSAINVDLNSSRCVPEIIPINIAQTTKPTSSITKKKIGGTHKIKKMNIVVDEATFVSYTDFKKQNFVEHIDVEKTVNDDVVVFCEQDIEVKKLAVSPKNECHQTSDSISQVSSAETKLKLAKCFLKNKLIREDANNSAFSIQLPSAKKSTIPDNDTGCCSGKIKVMSFSKSDCESNQNSNLFCENSPVAKKPKLRKSLIESDYICKPDQGEIKGSSKTMKASYASSHRHKNGAKRVKPELSYEAMPELKKTKHCQLSSYSDSKSCSIVKEVPLCQSSKEEGNVRRSSRLRKVLNKNVYEIDVSLNQEKIKPKINSGKHSTPKAGHTNKTISIPGLLKDNLETAFHLKKTSNESSRLLAPLFVRKVKQSLPKMDTEMFEKRKSFLMSGIPEKLQKQIELSDAYNINHSGSTFTTIKHVQQKESTNANLLWNLKIPEILVGFSEDNVINSYPNRKNLHYGLLTKCDEVVYIPQLTITSHETGDSRIDVSNILAEIQQKNTLHDVLAIYQAYVQKRQNAWITETNDEIPTSDQNDIPECVPFSDEEPAKVQKIRVHPKGRTSIMLYQTLLCAF